MKRSKIEKILFPVLLIFSLLLMAFYVLESRMLHPFNFLKTYAGYRPPMTVQIAPAGWILFTGILFFAFAMALVMPSAFFRRLHERFIQVRRRHFIGFAALLAFLLSSLINFLVYDNIPKNLDEIGYLFQAHHFAAGKLYSRAPLEGFNGFLNIVTDEEGKIYGAHFPGMSLMQTPAVFIGQSWLTGPLLGALSLIILFSLVRRLYHETLARYVILFALFSPFYIFMNATFMSHPGTAFLTLLFCYFFTGWIGEGKKYAPCLTGLSLGFLALTRPLTGLLITLPFLIYLAAVVIRRRRRILIPVIQCLLPVFMLMALFAGYVKILTGDPLTLPTQIQNPNFSPGFGAQKGIPVRGGKRQPFYLREGINQVTSKTVMLGVDLYGWGGFSLIFLPFVLAAPEKNRWDFLFLAAFLLLMLNYLVTPAKGMAYGPRYFFAAVPFLFILTVRGIQGASALLSKIPGPGERKAVYNYGIRVFVIFAMIFSLRCGLEYIPMKVDKYRSIQPRFLLHFEQIKF